jgi:GxxExxY protein
MGQGRKKLPENAHRELTDRTIGAAMSVSNELGIGFLEKVYENALRIELKDQGLSVEQQKSLEVVYKGEPVGDYVADLIVDDTVIIELKCADSISKAHNAQLLNYLKATGIRVGLLFNFGTPRLGIRRLVF